MWKMMEHVLLGWRWVTIFWFGIVFAFCHIVYIIIGSSVRMRRIHSNAPRDASVPNSFMSFMFFRRMALMMPLLVILPIIELLFTAIVCGLYGALFADISFYAYPVLLLFFIAFAYISSIVIPFPGCTETEKLVICSSPFVFLLSATKIGLVGAVLAFGLSMYLLVNVIERRKPATLRRFEAE